MMDLYESVYIDAGYEAYINITQKKLIVNQQRFEFEFFISKIFHITENLVYLGSEYGIVTFDLNTNKVDIIYKFIKDNYRSNDGVLIGDKYYLGYMSKNYDDMNDCHDKNGFIVEFGKNIKIIEKKIGIPNFMTVYQTEFIYVDSEEKTLNKLGNKKIYKYYDIADGGFIRDNHLYLCCYNTDKIIVHNLKSNSLSTLLKTTAIPTSCTWKEGYLYYTSSIGLNKIKKEI